MIYDFLLVYYSKYMSTVSKIQAAIGRKSRIVHIHVYFYAPGQDQTSEFRKDVWYGQTRMTALHQAVTSLMTSKRRYKRMRQTDRQNCRCIYTACIQRTACETAKICCRKEAARCFVSV